MSLVSTFILIKEKVMHKKVLSLMPFFLVLAGFLFGERQNENNLASVGICGTYSGFNWKLSSLDSIDQKFSLVGGGFFLDVTYLRLGSTFGYLLSYKFVYQDGNYTEELAVSEARGYFLDIYALLKFPFKISHIFYLWPAAGVLYSMALKIDIDGNGTNDIMLSDTPNDFYIIAGAGMDFKFNGFTLTPSVLYGMNLTPTQTTASLPSGVSASGNKLICSLGFTFKV
jgi:hypothetical protein